MSMQGNNRMLSSKVAEYVQHPRNIGPLEGASYGVSGVPGEGPSMQMWLRIEGGRIVDAAYRTHGCPSSIASGSCICDLVRGRTLEQAGRLTADDVRLFLGGLPEGKGHFADMGVEALRRALNLEP
jgi:NifU-like protein